MAIKISQGFKRTSKDPIDETLALTKAQMKSVDEASLPDKYFTICQDDGKLYLYDKNNTVDEQTGKFRLQEGGGSYILPTASATTLGGIKVGSNLTITNNGVLSADKVVEEFNSNTDYGYSDIARACRRNVVYVGDGTDKRKPVVFFELNDSTSTAILYTAEKNGFSAYKWNFTEYVGKTSLTTIPNGGTTGQVLAKKSDTDQDFDWETIVSDGWGVAKIGSVSLTSTGGSHIPFQIIDITDLNLESVNDYEVFVTIEDDRSTAYKVNNAFADKMSTTQFEVGFYTPYQGGLTVNISYVVIAKGFQSIMGGGSGLPSGGVKGDIIVKKSSADGDVEWAPLDVSEWGVAKSDVVNVPITNQQGSFTISIADLGIASVSDYNVVFSIVGGTGTGAWGDSTVFAHSRTTSVIMGTVNTLQGDIQSVLVSYAIVAKGYGTTVGSGSGTLSSGFGLTLNNNEISLTKCAVESVISNGYTKFYDKNDQGALFKPSENGMRYVYGDMGAETGEEIELVNKQYVDNKEPDAITNQDIDKIIFGE